MAIESVQPLQLRAWEPVRLTARADFPGACVGPPGSGLPVVASGMAYAWGVRSSGSVPVAVLALVAAARRRP